MNVADRIDYTRPFAEQVQGTLYARFRLDAYEAPTYEFGDGGRYYSVDVHLRSPRAERIEEVAYFLDDPTSRHPLGESSDRANDFRATIESPGDALLRVEVRTAEGVYEQRAWLSQMLENGYSDGAGPAVQSALLHIKVN